MADKHVVAAQRIDVCVGRGRKRAQRPLSPTTGTSYIDGLARATYWSRMTLSADLARARTEEDVKDAYIKALSLRDVFKGQIDIKTDKIWFEAKDSPKPSLVMFGQLMVYVRGARKRGEPIPPLLAVVDREKAALLTIEHALPILDDKAIVWPSSGSEADRAFAAQISTYLEGKFTTWRIASHEQEFVDTTKAAIRDGQIIRTPITRHNLRQVFDKWMDMIGEELGDVAPSDFGLLFFADIMHDGQNAAITGLSARLLYDGRRPVFLLAGRTYELASDRGYRDFWSIFNRPPEQNDRHYLLERRGSLLPMNEQKFRGEYYTPFHIVDKAYDQLTATLGADWQERYIVWDMCCGVGNLEVKHSNYRNVFMSTLEQADIDIMRASRTCAGATIFQYDYLNDDITDFGEIDYSITGKVPVELRQAIAEARAGKEGAREILVLINPPYAEATNDNTTRGVATDSSGDKKGVAKTKAAESLLGNYGKASNELFAQFVVRIYNEAPGAVLAMFSTLKYVISPTMDEFRSAWKARYLDGFVVHSRAFDGVGGDFPIGFLIWETAVPEPITKVEADVLDRFGERLGNKTFTNAPKNRLLTSWIRRPKSNGVDVISLKNAITPATATKDLRGTKWSTGALGYMWCNSNDVQQASKTALFSSGFNGGHGLYVNPDNLWQSAVVFAVRRLIKATWLNDRDQFLQAQSALTDEFKSDCLMWMLFHGSNLTAGADGLRWNDQDWSVVNHFIPFRETEVGASGHFESDFMAQYISHIEFSPEASSVKEQGRQLWERYHSLSFPRKIREELKLNRPDAGWYQVRNALKAYVDTEFTDLATISVVHAALTAKLRPQVYSLGFLPN